MYFYQNIENIKIWAFSIEIEGNVPKEKNLYGYNCKRN